MRRLFIIPDVDPGERLQTRGEEIANSVSHGVGLLAAIATVPFLIGHAVRTNTTSVLVGACVFSSTMILLYLVSTLYHAFPRGPIKHAFRIIEHVAIYFLIAGTYTPFTLGVLHGSMGWTLFSLIWAFAAAGVVLKLWGGVRFPILSTVLYLLMGWTLLIAIRPLWHQMPRKGFLWLFLGGLAYTSGVAFYAVDRRMRYSHFIWHLFVLAGTAFHYLAVYWYADI